MRQRNREALAMLESSNRLDAKLHAYALEILLRQASERGLLVSHYNSPKERMRESKNENGYVSSALNRAHEAHQHALRVLHSGLGCRDSGWKEEDSNTDRDPKGQEKDDCMAACCSGRCPPLGRWYDRMACQYLHFGC